MRAISREIESGLCPVIKCIDRRAVRFQSHAVDACIRSHAARHFSQFLVDVLIVKVQSFRFAFVGRHAQARRNMIDCDYSFRAEQVCALDRELAYWSTTPNSDGITRLDVAVLGGHVTGWKNIREKKYLLVVQILGNLYRSHVSERHTHILSLAAGI